MTTITINEQTVAGKMLLELAKLLSATNEGIIIENQEIILREEEVVYLKNLKKAAIEMKDLSSGKTKGQSLQSFLDEL